MSDIISIYGICDRDIDYSVLSGYSHDHSITRLKNNKIVSHISIESLSNKKFDNRMDKYIEDLILNHKEFQLEENTEIVSVNCCCGNSIISQNGKFRFEAVNLFNSIFLEPMPASCMVEKKFRFNSSYKSWNISHEIAHIFSCLPFYGNFKNNSLLIHFDGGASASNFSAYYFNDNKLELIEYGWDMWTFARIFQDNPLSFSLINHNIHNHGLIPGKLMAYSCLNEEFDLSMQNWLLENNFFMDCSENPEYATFKEQEFYKDVRDKFNWSKKIGDLTDPFLQKIAFNLQKIFENSIIQKLFDLKSKYNTDYLYYTGGCALNILANSKIVEQNIFKNVFIPPCCDDSGLSIGGAAFLNWKNNNAIEIHTPYLNNFNISLKNQDYKNIKNLTELILNNKIIGIFQGSKEVGPRALGNRSLICRPDSKELFEKLSQKIKKREWYRPLAPIILEKNVKKITGIDSIPEISKYMLIDFEIKNEYIKYFSGTIHSNNRSRIQTVFNRDQNILFWELLNDLESHEIYGLINTSFNKNGFPIVHLEHDALKVAKELNLDYLYINGDLIKIR